ncbi:MAG: thioredoxin family protein [Bacteroidales bacterium]
MIQDITNFEEFNTAQKNRGCLIYFSHQKCNVCKVLKPKIHQLLSDHFPEIKMFYCDTELYPEIAAQNSIFTVPTIIIFFDQKEFFRKSRNIGIQELTKDLERPYSLMFQ